VAWDDSYSGSDNPSNGALSSFDGDPTDEHANRSKQLTNPQEQLYRPRPFDLLLRIRAHGLSISVSIRNNQVLHLLVMFSSGGVRATDGIRMPVEFDQWSILLRFCSRWCPACNGSSLGVETFVGRAIERVPIWRVVEERRLYSAHCGDCTFLQQ
jgi:hypothetical protein